MPDLPEQHGQISLGSDCAHALSVCSWTDLPVLQAGLACLLSYHAYSAPSQHALWHPAAPQVSCPPDPAPHQYLQLHMHLGCHWPDSPCVHRRPVCPVCCVLLCLTLSCNELPARGSNVEVDKHSGQAVYQGLWGRSAVVCSWFCATFLHFLADPPPHHRFPRQTECGSRRFGHRSLAPRLVEEYQHLDRPASCFTLNARSRTVLHRREA